MQNVLELAEVDVNEEEDEWSAGGGETRFEDGEEELEEQMHCMVETLKMFKQVLLVGREAISKTDKVLTANKVD